MTCTVVRWPPWLFLLRDYQAIQPTTLWMSFQGLNLHAFTSWPSQLLRPHSLDEAVTLGTSLESSGNVRTQKHRALASLLKNSLAPEQRSEVITLSLPLQHSQFKKRLTPCFHTIGTLQHSPLCPKVWKSSLSGWSSSAGLSSLETGQRIVLSWRCNNRRRENKVIFHLCR